MIITIGRALLILSALALSVAAQQSNSLIICGQPGSAKVIQVNGRNYAEVEGLDTTNMPPEQVPVRAAGFGRLVFAVSRAPLAAA